jgi:hypothetical protein
MFNSKDWDIVVILDACRYDVLNQVSDWPIQRVTSPASCTPEWLKKIENQEVFGDACIVTGNAQYKKVGFDGEVEPFWKTHWNDQLSTVLPGHILDRTSEIVANGDGPVVAHLQQPHWPYVAKLSDTWQVAYEDTGPWTDGDVEIDALQVAMERGLIDLSAARKAYKASVKSVWNTLVDYLEDWVENSQSVVVTADHGETFGRIRDYRLYEHPCKCHLKPVVTVPWVSLTPQRDPSPDEGTVTDRLKALGYTE